jgi:hypothetical protein
MVRVKKAFIVGLLMFVVVSSADTASGQLGVGTKIPSAEVFVALVSEQAILEVGVIPGFLGGAIALVADGKLLFGELADLPLWPFVGAGITISLTGQAIFFSPHALGGLEFRFTDIPLSLFGEVGVSLTFGALGIGLVPGGQIGARFDF